MNWLIERAHAVDFDWLTPNGSPSSTGVGYSNIFTQVIGIIEVIAAGLAVIYLIYSGILYITAAGNPDAAKKGQQGVINAVIGIVIIVAAYFIINVAINLARSASG
ncbi:MAG: hypothetical protein NTW79_02265 [Candidatus Berkelbacteria bacterium]|nr:hypothetical protein [Candidatus Berkelbacteria bacterium]